MSVLCADRVHDACLWIVLDGRPVRRRSVHRTPKDSLSYKLYDLLSAVELRPDRSWREWEIRCRRPPSGGPPRGGGSGSTRSRTQLGR